MADYKRATRVKELLREEISQIITMELKDPLVGMTTVTEVKLTNDLKSARVYVNIYGDDSVTDKTLRGLNRAKKFIRTELGKRTELKFVPEIRFIYDDTIDHAQNIEAILNKIHKDEDDSSDSERDDS